MMVSGAKWVWGQPRSWASSHRFALGREGPTVRKTLTVATRSPATTGLSSMRRPATSHLPPCAEPDEAGDEQNGRGGLRRGRRGNRCRVGGTGVGRRAEIGRARICRILIEVVGAYGEGSAIRKAPGRPRVPDQV